jgi:acyl homoserine lactone synthase
MLKDVFSELMDGEPVIESPLIWESTRFCVSAAAALERSPNQLNRTTGELLAGIVEVGRQAGLISVVSVYDAIMKRVLERAGCPADQVGTPKKIGKCTTFAGLFAIDDDMLARIKHASGLTGSVLAPDTVAEALAA